MGLVLALFVGCLAWRIVFYSFYVITAFVIKYPKWIFGTLAAVVALFVALIVGFLVWASYFDPNRPSMIVTHWPDGTETRGGVVINQSDFNRSDSEVLAMPSPSPSANTTEVRRAELVDKPKHETQATVQGFDAEKARDLNNGSWRSGYKQPEVRRAELVKP
jgi:hypothetical protein